MLLSPAVIDETLLLILKLETCPFDNKIECTQMMNNKNDLINSWIENLGE